MSTTPTEPIGSIPRPLERIEARLEETGSPVITYGEQRKYHNFWTYSVHGLPNTAADGFKIPFSAGVHTCPGGDRNSTHSADVDYAEEDSR